MTNDIISPDLSLVMIVRDELINPAGGLLPVLEKQSSYYPEIVILDTGSKDGTRELLEHLSGQDIFPNLKVHDAKFWGYSHARNKLNSLVNTKYTLSLDSDEILSESTSALIQTAIGKTPNFGFINVPINQVYDSGGVYIKRCQWNCWNNRIYSIKGAKFHDGGSKEFFNGEYLDHTGFKLGVPNTQIIHFVPSRDELVKKSKQWTSEVYNHVKTQSSPSSMKNFLDWKLPSPKILERYRIDFSDTVQKLTQLGYDLPDRVLELVE